LIDAGMCPRIDPETTMTPLRQRMLDALELRAMAVRTREAYIDAVAKLAKHYKRSPDQLSADQVQAYLLYLLRERKLARASINQYGCAFRFLYGTVLGLDGQTFQIPLGPARSGCPRSSRARNSCACSPRRGTRSDAGGTVFLKTLAKPVHDQHALLLDALDGHEAHVRPTGRLADGSGVVGVVLARGAFGTVRRGKLRRDDACVETHRDELAAPVVGRRADLHRDDAARRQLPTPGDELVAGQGTVRDGAAGRVDSVDLDHALGQIDPDAHDFPALIGSCNLVHGTSPFAAVD
jgi:Phage integrase, N-terminal SAM-like domain